MMSAKSGTIIVLALESAFDRPVAHGPFTKGVAAHVSLRGRGLVEVLTEIPRVTKGCKRAYEQ